MIYYTVLIVILLVGSTEMLKKAGRNRPTPRRNNIREYKPPTDQEELVQYLFAHYKISNKIKNALKKVDRKNFYTVNPYEEPTHKFGIGVNTSSPYMHAVLMKLLDKQLLNGHTVLDVNCGNGYLTACMSVLIGEDGFMVGIDKDKANTEAARKSVSVGNADLFGSNRLVFVEGNGKTWDPSFGNYDAIVVQGAVTKVPKELLEALDTKGRMLIPIITESSGKKTQDLWVVDRHSDYNVTRQKLFPVFYDLL